MATITKQAALQHALDAGFRGDSAVTAVSIAMAESNLDTAARHVNTDGSVDRGLYQINSRWHPEVTDAQAFDPAQASVAAFHISSSGTNFSPWSTYTSGAYKQHTSEVQQALNQLQPAPAPVRIPVPRPPIVDLTATMGNVNQWIGFGMNKIGIVFHVMEGTLVACDNWFTNPAAQASANFGIGHDGTIHMYVNPWSRNCPYANGIVNAPDDSVRALLGVTGNRNPNFWTVSIEHEGYSGDLATQAQRFASAWLAAYHIDQLGVVFDEDHLLGHYEFDSVTRAGCPGWDRNGWVTQEQLVSHFLKRTIAEAPTMSEAGVQELLHPYPTEVEPRVLDMAAFTAHHRPERGMEFV